MGHAVIVEIGGPVCGIYTTSAVTGQDGFLPRAASQQKNVESCKSYVTERKDYPDATRISFTWREHHVGVAQKRLFILEEQNVSIFTSNTQEQMSSEHNTNWR